MNYNVLATAIVGVFSAGSLALAGAAAAAPLAGSSADDTINQLKSEGYNVQLNLNGPRESLLSECTVDGVHGIPNNVQVGQPISPKQFTTVYVDVNCPSDES